MTDTDRTACPRPGMRPSREGLGACYDLTDADRIRV